MRLRTLVRRLCGDDHPKQYAALNSLRRGRLKLTLKGRRLRGSWVLVRIGGRRWLLFKHRDRFASSKDVLWWRPGRC